MVGIRQKAEITARLRINGAGAAAQRLGLDACLWRRVGMELTLGGEAGRLQWLQHDLTGLTAIQGADDEVAFRVQAARSDAAIQVEAAVKIDESIGAFLEKQIGIFGRSCWLGGSVGGWQGASCSW